MAKILDKWKAWWGEHNDPLCRECGLGYQEARDTIKALDRIEATSHKVELQLINERAEAKNTIQANRDLLVMLNKHFVLLQRIANSPGPIKQDNKVVSKYKVIVQECEAARTKIQKHLEGIRE